MESLNSPTTTSAPMPSTISVPDKQNTTISTITTNIETPMAPTTTKTDDQHQLQDHEQHQQQHLSDKLISSLVKKPQKPDAPMLNYIFDSISAANRHQHYYDQR